MTPAEFLAARTGLGLTQGALATVIGVARRTVQHWEAADVHIPVLVARVLRAALADRTILDKINQISARIPRRAA